ncbi:MAG: hypothetical protein KDC54_17680, partial [Lewinella sp.]|nr:hypothetical protein [Lewinella sp.]
PLREKLLLVELLFRDIREEALSEKTEQRDREEAAAALVSDYEEGELTAFTALDSEDFYETR